MQTQTLQIFQYERVVYGDAPERRAAVHLPAVGAGVESLFPDAVMHGQSLSQKGVFAPSMRQSVQFIISGLIVTPLSFVHRAAVFSRRVLSSVTVAIRASHFSQSSPQQPISSFISHLLLIHRGGDERDLPCLAVRFRFDFHILEGDLVDLRKEI